MNATAAALTPVSAPTTAAERPRRAWWRWLDLKFVLALLLPTLLAIIYYGFVATDVYLSESKFVVRSPQRSAPTSLGALLQGTGISKANDDTYTVHDFMLSRDSLRELDAQLNLRKSYSDPAIDRLNRFPILPWDDSFEALFRHYLSRVDIAYDTASSITSLTIRAHTAREAQAINELLLRMSEQLVNRLNDRSRQDLIQSAEQEARSAQERARDTAQALSAYRSDRSVFDPSAESGLQLGVVSRLQEELRGVEAQAAQLRRVAPNNPQLPDLSQRTLMLRQQIAAESAKVTGRGASFSSAAKEYDRLQLEKVFAEQNLAAAMASLQGARNEAIRKSLYIERIVQPNLADYAAEPERLRKILTVLMVGLIVWGLLRLVVSSVREHAD